MKIRPGILIFAAVAAVIAATYGVSRLVSSYRLGALRAQRPCDFGGPCAPGPFIDADVIPTVVDKACSSATEQELKTFNVTEYHLGNAPCRPDVPCSTATGLLRERGACVPDTFCFESAPDLAGRELCRPDPCSRSPEEEIRAYNETHSASRPFKCTPDAPCSAASDYMKKYRYCVPDTPCSQAPKDLFDLGLCVKEKCSETPVEFLKYYYNSQAFSYPPKLEVKGGTSNRSCTPDLPCAEASPEMFAVGACIQQGCSTYPAEVRDEYLTRGRCKADLPDCMDVSDEEYMAGDCLRPRCSKTVIGMNGGAITPYIAKNWRFDRCYHDLPCSTAPELLTQNGACIPDAATGTAP